MADHMRRHVTYLSDREVGVVERALKAYHTVLGIQTAARSPREADDIAHVAATIQAHSQHCKCPPEGGS